MPYGMTAITITKFSMKSMKGRDNKEFQENNGQLRILPPVKIFKIKIKYTFKNRS